MRFKIHQRGVQWKEGVVVRMLLYTSLLYNTTPIHCNPLPLHAPVMNAHMRWNRNPRPQPQIFSKLVFLMDVR